ncbi:hypothetical protein GCM10009836_27830 [Pseudonocardia ailaonensis]|uniref:Uncharacterized protein n=1 Tax=Pseudonocardia ailaonensis TaxID=367279 RepID=A0ABN2N097_9PSEU
MRRTFLALGVITLAAAGAIVAATGASAAPAGQPGVAHGYYVALNGTADDGSWSPQSDAIVNPEMGRCYDLGSVVTGPAAWTESVNRTDQTAVLSQRTCAERTGGPAATHQSAPADHADSVTFAFRSVTFTHLP